MMKKLIAVSAILAFATAAQAQLVPDTNLGVLPLGATNLVGDTANGSNQVDFYNPGDAGLLWINEFIYEFALGADASVDLTLNSQTADTDFFVLDGLSISVDGGTGNTIADDWVPPAAYLDGSLPDTISMGVLTTGTYYLSASTFQSNPTSAYDLDILLSLPPIVSDLGTHTLNDGFYDREAGGDADHPYGEVPFFVDTDGTYDIQSDWFDPTGAPFDGYLYLFDAPFTGDDSTAIASDDDFNGLDSSLIEDVALTAGANYYLVLTTFSGMPGVTDLTGDVTVFGPGNASLVPEPGSLAIALLLGLGLSAAGRRRLG